MVLPCLTICARVWVGCYSSSSGVPVYAAIVRVSPVASQCRAVSSYFKLLQDFPVVFQCTLQVLAGSPSGIGPVSVHWLRVMARISFTLNADYDAICRLTLCSPCFTQSVKYPLVLEFQNATFSSSPTFSNANKYQEMSETRMWVPTYINLDYIIKVYAMIFADGYFVSICTYLTHWGRDKMDPFSQTTFFKCIFLMKMYEFRSRFLWSLFPNF